MYRGKSNRRTIGWLLVAGITLWAAAAPAQWRSVDMLRVPQHPYSFLAATPSGDLLAATFNNKSGSQSAAEMPALLIRDPLGPKPHVIELCRVAFLPNRGYSGIACMADGSFFVAGDTGDPRTCFLRKFRSDGAADPVFGAGGVLLPGRRCLGVEVMGEYLLAAVDWGEILVLNASDGRKLGVVPKGQGEHYVRDIAIDPRTMQIFGVEEGSVVVWEGGNPWEPNVYVFRSVTAKAGSLRSGEGISIDPQAQTAIIQPVPGNELLAVRADGATERTVVTTARPGTHLPDSVLSFDGSTLFVSDMILRTIHVLKRGAGADAVSSSSSAVDTENAVESAVSRPASAPEPAAARATPDPAYEARTTWRRSYLETVEAARRAGNPMVVYFRQTGTRRCEDIEKSVLLTAEFDRRAQGFVCVFEDLAVNRLFAYKFGVFRVPHIVVLDARGNVVSAMTFNIDGPALFAGMDRAARSAR